MVTLVDGTTEDGLRTIFATNLFGHFTLASSVDVDSVSDIRFNSRLGFEMKKRFQTQQTIQSFIKQ